MKTVVKPDLKSKTFRIIKSFALPREKAISFIDYKFYQKIFIVFISLSAILIIPETPREFENICQRHNSIESCLVW